MKNIFNEFLAHTGKGQAEFFEKYLPMLLMAIDKDLYLELYKKAYGNEKLNELIIKL